MSHSRSFLPSFSAFDLDHFILAGIWALIIELIRYAPKIWARKGSIGSLVKRRTEIVVVIGVMSGLALAVSSPIISTNVTQGGNALYGGTSTAITSRFTYIIDLRPLEIVFVSAIIIMLVGAAISEYRRIRREHFNLNEK